jgi:hypothetical protein
MEAIIGKYRVRMEETSLILTHATGISFDLTLDEAVGLMEFIKVYQAAIAAAQRDTEPRIERIVVDKQSSSDMGRSPE